MVLTGAAASVPDGSTELTPALSQDHEAFITRNISGVCVTLPEEEFL